MSNPMALEKPASLAMWRLAMAPAAIPEAAKRTAIFSTVLGVITPPPE